MSHIHALLDRWHARALASSRLWTDHWRPCVLEDVAGVCVDDVSEEEELGAASGALVADEGLGRHGLGDLDEIREAIREPRKLRPRRLVNDELHVRDVLRADLAERKAPELADVGQLAGTVQGSCRLGGGTLDRSAMIVDQREDGTTNELPHDPPIVFGKARLRVERQVWMYAREVDEATHLTVTVDEHFDVREVVDLVKALVSLGRERRVETHDQRGRRGSVIARLDHPHVLAERGDDVTWQSEEIGVVLHELARDGRSFGIGERRRRHRSLVNGAARPTEKSGEGVYDGKAQRQGLLVHGPLRPRGRIALAKALDEVATLERLHRVDDLNMSRRWLRRRRDRLAGRRSARERERGEQSSDRSESQTLGPHSRNIMITVQSKSTCENIPGRRRSNFRAIPPHTSPAPSAARMMTGFGPATGSRSAQTVGT